MGKLHCANFPQLCSGLEPTWRGKAKAICFSCYLGIPGQTLLKLGGSGHELPLPADCDSLLCLAIRPSAAQAPRSCPWSRANSPLAQSESAIPGRPPRLENLPRRKADLGGDCFRGEVLGIYLVLTQFVSDSHLVEQPRRICLLSRLHVYSVQSLDEGGLSCDFYCIGF